MLLCLFMKLALAATLLLCNGQLLGYNDPTAQQSLITAKQQASLSHGQGKPYQLDVDFVVQIRVPTQGRLTLKWESNDRWWSKIVMGDFEQIEVRNGERFYTKRNIDFTPVRLVELISLLQFAEGSEGLIVKKQKYRLEDGVRMSCLQVERENVRAKPHEVCINSVSNEIMRDEWQEPPDERRKEQYSDYFDFSGHHYPRKLQLFVNGSAVITATVRDLSLASFEPALLLPPEGAIERRKCSGIKHPVPVRTPDPAYPGSASENKLTGDTTVAMTVMTDGSVSNIRLVGSATHSMDDATLQTLRSWRFKPAMCGSEPVLFDIEVVVSFRLE